MKDSLGDRMKEYENVTRFKFSRRSYTIIRIDGKAFHSYTKGLIKPFDDGLINDMDATAAYLCKNIMGAKFAFVQSDEISILLTDFEEINTQAWFDNNLQKMCSVSASMATRAFNETRLKHYNASYFGVDVNSGLVKEYTHKPFKWGEFDSRVFQIPQKTEVMNYFLWRQKDTTRNSIQSVAQSLYSTKQKGPLHGKNSDQLQEMIFQKGINWNDYAPKYKRGRIILKEQYTKQPELPTETSTVRTRWISVEPPIFTQEKDFLNNLIPNNF